MKKVRKAIIPVAGMGTRFLPVTKSLPKEMLPIIDRPTIQYIIEEAAQSGIEEILFVTSPYKKAIEDYFDRSYELEKRLLESGKDSLLEKVQSLSNMVKIFFIRQGEPLGTGHAVRICKAFIGDEPFAVLYGDDIIDAPVPGLKQLIEVYEEKDCNVFCALELPIAEIPSKGVLSFQDMKTGKISGLVEKPKLEEAPSHYGAIGRYILKPEIFEELEKIEPVKGEYLITDAMLRLMKRQDFYATFLKGEYYDVGNQLGYLRANIEFGLKREDIKEPFTSYLKEVISKIAE